MSEKYNLSWNDFPNSVSETFKNLIDDKDFIDVTLISEEGTSIKAHKVILSSASSLFKTILTQNPNQHPLLYLKGMKYWQLQSILNFIYLGVAEIAQEDLDSFMEAAVELKIDGLQEMHQVSKKENDEKTIDDQPSNPIHVKTPLKQEVKLLDDIEIVAKEDVYGRAEASYVNKSYSSIILSCDQCDYQTNRYHCLKRHKLGKHDGIKYPCNLCDRQYSTKDNLKNHQDSKHQGKVYGCTYCEYNCENASKLSVHISRNHK